MKTDKLGYEAPRLKQWGKIADLTQFGGFKPPGDGFNGSVNKPPRGRGPRPTF